MKKIIENIIAPLGHQNKTIIGPEYIYANNKNQTIVSILALLAALDLNFWL